MKYKKQIFGGICAALLMWALLIIADAFDELIVEASIGAAYAMYFIAPLVLYIFYIIRCVRKRPSVREIFAWHCGYIIAFLPLWLYTSVTDDSSFFFIEQKRRETLLDLNGIEYLFYGFSALIAFTVLCIIFHIIRYAEGRRRKHHKHKQ